MVNGSLKPRKTFSSSKPQEAGNLADQLLTVKNKYVFVTRNNVYYAVEDVVKASGQVILLVEEDGKPVKSDWLAEELKDATGLDVFIELEGKLYPALSFSKGTIQAKSKVSGADTKADKGKIDNTKERQAKIKALGKELAKSSVAKSLIKEVQSLVDSNPGLFVNDISTSLLLREFVSDLEESNSITYQNKTKSSVTVSSINGKDISDLKRTLENKFKVTAEFVQIDDSDYNITIEGDISDPKLQAKIEGMIEMYLDADVSVDTIEDDFISFNISLSDSSITSKKRSAPTEDRDPSNVEKEIPVPDKDKAKTRKRPPDTKGIFTDDETDDATDEPSEDIEVSTFD